MNTVFVLSFYDSILNIDKTEGVFSTLKKANVYKKSLIKKAQKGTPEKDKSNYYIVQSPFDAEP